MIPGKITSTFLIRIQRVFRRSIVGAYGASFMVRHNRKVLVPILVVAMVLIGVQPFTKVHAGVSFQAGYEFGSLNADSGLGSTTASFSNPAPSIVAGNGSSGAVTVLPGQALSYGVSNNLPLDKGDISIDFKSPYTAFSSSQTHALTKPSDVFYDPGTAFLYITDSWNNRIIRTKIDGTQWQSYGGLGNGQGQFNQPSGIYFDSGTGLIHVSDLGNNRIVQFKWGGESWASYGSYGSGVGHFNEPSALDFDPATGFLYVVDATGSRVVKTKMDGTGWTVLTSFTTVADIAYDAQSDFIYYSGSYNGVVTRIKIDGTQSTSFTGFTNAQGLALNTGGSILYLADGGVLRKLNASTGVEFQNYVFSNDPSTYALGIAFDSNSSLLYVPWNNEATIERTSITGTSQVMLGSSGKSDGSLVSPQNIAYDAANDVSFITESTPSVVVEMNTYGTTHNVIGTKGAGVGQFNHPHGIMYDPASQDLFIADTDNHRIIRTKRDFSDWQSLGSLGSGVNQFNSPTRVAYDSTTGYIYVTDQNNNRIVKTKIDGTGWTTLGGTSGSGVGQFYEVTSIAVDTATKDLFIVDQNNNWIVKTKIDGTGWSTLGDGSYGSGVGQFGPVDDVAYDQSTGFLYITDAASRIIKTKFDKSGWTTLNSSGAHRFDNSRAISYNSADATIRVISAMDGSVVTLKMDGTMISSYNGSGTRTLLQTSGGSPLSLSLDRDSAEVTAVIAAGENALQLQSPSITLAAGAWYTLKLHYDNALGQLALYLNGSSTPLAQSTPGAWANPTNLGQNIGIGTNVSNPNQNAIMPLDNISIHTLNGDVTAPTVPTQVSLSDHVGGTQLLDQQVSGSPSSSWYSHKSPSFAWTGSTDTESAIFGYFVYFGTNSSTDPSQGTFTASPTFTPPTPLSIDGTYYLRVKSQDASGNVSSAATLFTYNFDTTSPGNPGFITVTPQGFTSTNTYTFTWPISGTGVAVDSSGVAASGVAGYQYKTGATSGVLSDWSPLVTSGQITLPNGAYHDGQNIFYLRTVDAAGNISNPMQATYYYSNSAPSSPLNLQATPTSSNAQPVATNQFAFNWSPPNLLQQGNSVKQYHYSVNSLPTSANSAVIVGTSLPLGAYATVQGKNVLYLVAEDSAGNVNYDLPASVEFYAGTPIPSAPTHSAITDISNRDTDSYGLTISWEAPKSLGTDFAGYEIFRSTDGGSYASLGRTSSTLYTDTNLEKGKHYYYQVKSRDTAGQYSAAVLIDGSPSGHFTQAATILVQPTVVTTDTSATITWTTDRVGSSFVQYDTSKTNLESGKASATFGQPDSVTKHTVVLTNLTSNTQYFAKASSLDVDQNNSLSSTISFVTSTQPTISNVKVEQTTSSSATLSWTSNVVTSSTVRYGNTLGYGRENSDTSNSATTNHTLLLSGLQDGTHYNFRINGVSDQGGSVQSDNYTFDTPPLPRILGTPAITDLPAKTTSTSAIDWQTNVASTSVVHYQDDLGYHEQASGDLSLVHHIEVANLPDHSKLTFEVLSTDGGGNVVSQTIAYTTRQDTRPPIITNFKVVNVVQGSDQYATAQVTVSWTTNKPSTSQVKFSQGSLGVALANQAGSSSDMTKEHSVAITLPPSTIFSAQAQSVDAGGNTGLSAITQGVTKDAAPSPWSVVSYNLSHAFRFLDFLFK